MPVKATDGAMFILRQLQVVVMVKETMLCACCRSGEIF